MAFQSSDLCVGDGVPYIDNLVLANATEHIPITPTSIHKLYYPEELQNESILFSYDNIHGQ
jgi:hypothetical protein